ncbi:MAG: gliding motility-associated C-terminal domain-containing protein [Ferruginibacter sp.]
MKKNLLLIVCIFFSYVQNVFSQATCNGSLGEPIVNITFGQGPNPGAVLSTVVPGASTSYTYVGPTGSPASNIVLDGDYAIVNSVPANPYWLQTGDHTNNGNGYMAFFNAAPDPGEFYKQTVSGLCPGTTYEFAAWIMNALNSDKAAGTVPPNVTFKIFNPSNLTTPLTSFSTGDILPTNVVVWKQFATLFTTPAGINSVVLTLTNNNIGGANSFGNDLAIDDITFRACGPLTSASFASASALNSLSICQNTSFKLYGSVSAGLNTPAYQWQISNNGGNTFTDISGATILNYTAAGLPAGNYKIRLVSQEAANIGSLYCKFFSNLIDLTVTTFVVDAGSDSSFCSNKPVLTTLHAKGGTTYTWSPAGLLDDLHSADPKAIVNTTTKFYVSVSNGVCSGIDSVTVFIKPLPTLVSSGNSSICKDSTLTLSASGAGSYTWSPVNLVSNPNIAKPVFTGTQSTAVYVTGTTNGCSKIDTLNIVVRPLPQVNTIPDTIICKQETITFTTTGASSYSWSPVFQLDNPGIANPKFNGSVGQKYYVTGLLAGCRNIDSVTVTIHNQNPFVQPPGKSTCLDKPINLDGFNGTDAGYSWTPAASLANPTTINPVATPGATTSYSVIVSDRYCSTDTVFNVLLTILPLPTVKAAKSNDLNCTSSSAQLSATGASTYNWTPSSSLDNAGSANPIASPKISTTYIVTGTDANKCMNIDSIQVVKTSTNNVIYIPNSFTPNHDGLNDCFHVLIQGGLKNFEFFIYDRWGKKVFESNNTGSCWDGRYKNIDSPAGNYVFYFKAITECGIIVKKGNVLLIR